MFLNFEIDVSEYEKGQMNYPLGLDALVARASCLTATKERALLGIVGPPGSGKSLLARQVAEAIGPAARVVPMDGYHLSNPELRRLGRADRKGAIDTFDAEGYLSLARRLAANERVVYAPEFDRAIEEPVAGSIRIDRSVRLVICEGNYLLVDRSPWDELRPLFAESWYCELPDEVRIERLIARHHAFGKPFDAARAWALGPDQTNAQLIETSRSRADVLARTG